MASGSQDGTIRLWRVEAEGPLRVLKGHKGLGPKGIRSLLWSSDDKILLSGCDLDDEARVWDVSSGKQIASIPAEQAPYSMALMAWSPDNRTAAVGFTWGWEEDSGVVLHGLCLWNAVSRKMPAALKVTSDRGAQCGPRLLRWSSDGMYLTFGHYDNTLRRWNVALRKQLECVYPHPRTIAKHMAMCPSTDTAATTTRGHTTFLWHTETGDPIAAMILLPEEQHLVISPQGHYQATGEIEKEFLYVVRTDKGQETLTPAEFAAKYGWKNDPTKVRLLPPTPPAKPTTQPATQPTTQPASQEG